MFKTLTAMAIVGAAGFAATGASAQMMTPMGEELYNQTVQVRFADGTSNTLRFQPNGALTISAPGVNPVNGTWRVQGNQLCLFAQGASECWNYTQRFAANQTVTLSSSCDSSAQWLATSVSPVQTMPQQQQVQPVERTGERG